MLLYSRVTCLIDLNLRNFLIECSKVEQIDNFFTRNLAVIKRIIRIFKTKTLSIDHTFMYSNARG